VPEEKHPAVIPGHEAGAEDNVGLPLENRSDQFRVLAGVVFQVSVLDDHHVPGCLPETGPEAPVEGVVISAATPAMAEIVTAEIAGNTKNDPFSLKTGLPFLCYNHSHECQVLRHRLSLPI
jgi:hypothetical protein